MLARRSQVHQRFLIQHASGGDQAWTNYMHALTQHALGRYPSLHDAKHHALAQFYRIVQAQASVLSYIDLAEALAVFAALMVPMALLLKKPPKGAQLVAH
jgi:hypothetical protein